VLLASFAGWIAVLATVGTALSVHVAATRYEFQLIEFSRPPRSYARSARPPPKPESPRRSCANLPYVRNG
jgi:hypothetical protein